MKAFLSTPKGAAAGGAIQMLAVLALVLAVGAAAPAGTQTGGTLLLLVPLLAAAAVLTVVFSALSAAHPPMRTGAWWVGQLAVLLVAAIFLGAWGSPALAQEGSDGTSASPDASASAPSETTNLLVQEQTSIESAGEGDVSPASAGGLKAGPVRIDDNCVQAGPVTIGDCGDKGGRPGGSGGGSGGQDSGGGQDPTEETTAPSSPPADDGSEDEPTNDEGCAAVGPLAGTQTVTIAEVVDGDTAELAEPIKGTTTVRFIGVDTPETVDPEEDPEPFGKEASTFTEKALEGEKVALELGEDAKDDYGRLLAYPWTADGMFSEALLEGGYGELLVIPPNDAYEECLAAAEERAKADGAGIWGLDGGSGNDPDESSPDPSDDPSANPPEGATDDSSADQPENADDATDSATEGVADPAASPEASAAPTDDAGTEEVPASDQYAAEDAEDASPAPATEPEVQEPEVQEPEVQEPEVQEAEIQDPEVQEPADPIVPSVASESSPVASAAPSEPVSSTPIVLPETGGPPLLALASALFLALLPAGLLTRAGLRRVRRDHRDGGDL